LCIVSQISNKREKLNKGNRLIVTMMTVECGKPESFLLDCIHDDKCMTLKLLG